MTQSKSQIELRLGDAEDASLSRRDLSGARHTVEHVEVGDGAEFGYQWSGPQHFLALHDIVLQDGEVDLEGLRTVGPTDLRNTLTFVPAGARVEGWSKTALRSNAFTAVYFNPEAVTEELSGLFAAGRPMARLYMRDTALVTTMGKLRSALTDPTSADSLHVDTLGVLMTIELSRALAEPNPISVHRGGLSERQLRNVREAVEASLDQPITLQALAGITGLSRYHFLRAFKKSTGLSPYQYVLERRIAKARDLIVDTRMPLAEVARATGFGSGAHLSRAFARATGLPPSAYRPKR